MPHWVTSVLCLCRWQVRHSTNGSIIFTQLLITKATSLQGFLVSLFRGIVVLILRPPGGFSAVNPIKRAKKGATTQQIMDSVILVCMFSFLVIRPPGGFSAVNPRKRAKKEQQRNKTGNVRSWFLIRHLVQFCAASGLVRVAGC